MEGNSVGELALDRLLEISLLLDKDTRRYLDARGLSASRAQLLYVLHGAGRQTQQALSVSLELTPRSVTTLVDQLVDAGHVTREPHPGDRRAVLVTHTPAGVALAAELAEGRVGLAATLFGDWPARERADLVRRLDAVLSTLRPLVEG